MAFCCRPPPHSFSLLFNHVVTFFYTPHNTIWPLRSTLFPKDNLLGALQVDPWTTGVNYMGPLTSGIFFFNKYNPPFASMYFTCEDSTSQMENSIFAFFLVSFKLVFPTADWKYCFSSAVDWTTNVKGQGGAKTDGQIFYCARSVLLAFPCFRGQLYLMPYERWCREQESTSRVKK